ncbi:UNVERIFIED_CONTAM: hypothetical protein HDU68_001438 [Siphonaria sp. JEL0065]|nr:hypothetical protein HDU68_001438 [Siphonaria sp. JEL0065]
MRHLGIAFDIDGVLIKGKKVLPQAIRAMQRIKENKVPFVLMTNGGGTTEINKAKELSGLLNTHIAPEQMILAHTPMASLSSKFSKDYSEAVLILGKEGCKDAALSYGFKHPILTEEVLATCPEIWPFRTPIKKYKPIDLNRKVGAILSFHDSQDWGRDIQIVCDLLRTNGDLKRVVGSFRHALEGVYHRLCKKKLEYTMFGKPYKSTYDYAKRAIDVHASRVLLHRDYESGKGEEERERRRYFGIGDNPESDIEGANRNGWTSVLVKTGVYEGGPHEAKYLVEDVEEAVDVILSRR